MVGVPGTCQHLRSPGTGSYSAHRRPHNTLPTPATSDRQPQARKFQPSYAISQLRLGEIAIKQQETQPPGDRTASARQCSTSYSLHSEECAACGRPLSGQALLWWSKLDRHSQQHRKPRLRKCCTPIAQSTANSLSSVSHKRKASNAIQAGRQAESSNKLLRDSDISSISEEDSDQPPETGIVSEANVSHVQNPSNSISGNGSNSATQTSAAYASPRTVLFPAKEQGNIKDSWQTLMRWSKVFKKDQNGVHVLDKTEKVVVFGGGSFGTAMGVALARQRSTLNVALLLRDAYNCRDINSTHTNTRYLPVSLLLTSDNAYVTAAFVSFEQNPAVAACE